VWGQSRTEESPGSAREVHREVLALKLRLLEAEVEEDELRAIEKLLPRDPAALPDGGYRALTAWTELWEAVLGRPLPAGVELASVAEAAEKDRAAAEGAWRAAAERSVHFHHEERREVENQIGLHWLERPGSSGGWAKLRLVILSGAAAIAVAAVLTVHE